ncbi:histone-lysine N-methyltransferase SUV39H2-like [Ctenocephalides felis]|uniref:histone-lysine N-methyltransferase SUV39H2-like n=1 Tax=Ctenocephalides felis TaxID=7515 RepID=UPI000E6E1CF2|nr:histone-lysine N-methyltransferase SUV39H2-like [Ctenocephalides felis]
MPRVRRKYRKDSILCVKLERLSSRILRKYNVDVSKVNRRSLRNIICSPQAVKENETISVEQKKSVKISSQTSGSSASKKSDKGTHLRRYSVVDPERSEYVVEAIRSVTIFNNIPRYEVKWLYWGEEYNTYEPQQNLNCSVALQNFLDSEYTKFEPEIEVLIKELAVGPMFTDSALKEFIVTGVTLDETLLKSYLLGLIVNPKAKNHVKVLQRVQSLLQKKIFLDKRKSQIEALREWENKMNEVDIKGKLRVINNVDFEGPPADFTYIIQNLPADDVKVSNNPSIGCSCMPCGFKTNCCGKLHGSEYAYFAEKRLKHTGIYIFECNKKCKCGPECKNRLVQKGRTNKLCIFKTSNGCGWGVKTDRHIKAGDFVCEYVGEIIKSDDAEQRGQLYDKMGVTYLFDLDHLNPSSEAYTIDAYRYGNVSHFINHSCEPNLCVVNVWVDCLDPNLSRLALFALEDIEKGQEVTIDYKFTENACSQSSKFMLCKCGAKSCRRILRYC